MTEERIEPITFMDIRRFQHGTVKTLVRIEPLGGRPAEPADCYVTVDHHPREFGLPDQLAAETQLPEAVNRLLVLHRKHRDEITRLSDLNADIEATLAQLREIQAQCL